MTSKRFRVALSFAGEKREFVEQVARILAERFGEDRILYDRYHEAEFARHRLAFHLSDLYSQHTDLVVAVLCEDYASKEWCGLEWDAIYSRIKGRHVNDVMLTRFGHVDGDGLAGLAGFIDLDIKTPRETARIILERLAVNENLPKHYYADSTAAATHDWPDTAPELQWPVADHREARAAFAQLITRSSSRRVLPIHGPSETGKSHLTKQFLRNAMGIPSLRCGRFDFKGSTDMRHEAHMFAEQLEVGLPAADASITAQLSRILASAREACRPTLFIFDTFEHAGDAARWVNDNLLFSIVRAPWLRVIIVGQKVLKAYGQPWEGMSASPILLRPPTAEEWFDYGQLHRPSISMEFVRQAYEYCEGSGPVLAQLIGPRS